MGKKIILTATLLNRLTFRIQYRLADHIFVHTKTMMKSELLEEFGVRARGWLIERLSHRTLAQARAAGNWGIEPTRTKA